MEMTVTADQVRPRDKVRWGTVEPLDKARAKQWFQVSLPERNCDGFITLWMMDQRPRTIPPDRKVRVRRSKRPVPLPAPVVKAEPPLTFGPGAPELRDSLKFYLADPEGTIFGAYPTKEAALRAARGTEFRPWIRCRYDSWSATRGGVFWAKPEDRLNHRSG